VSGIGEPGYDTMYFAYDALARRTEVETGTQKETLTYDTLGRVSEAVNPLGTFSYTFLGNSRLPSVVTGGPIKTTYDYDPLPDEIRLKSLENEAGSTVLDNFTYTYNPTGTIATWGNSYSSGANMGTASATYDADNRLTGWGVKDSANAVIADQAFTYDAMGNRETANTNGVVDTYATNTVNGYTAESLPAVKESYSYGYDANGSLNVALFTDTANTSLNYKAEFVYDGQNRLAEILNGTHESVFTYNAEDRITKDVEYVSGKLASTTTYLWLGNRLLEEKTANGTKYFYRQGLVETNAEKLYYTRDHLGSIREITESTGALVAKYQYDPWGVTTQLAGTYVSDIGYEGYLKHTVSGLLITPHRFYAPRMGRWMSDDPAGMHGGTNLYGFDYNDPLGRIDPSGLTPLGAMAGVISYADLGGSTLRQVSAMSGSPTRQKRITIGAPGGGDSGEEPVEVDDPPYDFGDPGDDEPPDNDGNYDGDDGYDGYGADGTCDLDPIQYWSDRGVEVYYPEDDPDDDNNYENPPEDGCGTDSSEDTTDDNNDNTPVESDEEWQNSQGGGDDNYNPGDDDGSGDYGGGE
jgi:RHS repeat-associated protein